MLRKDKGRWNMEKKPIEFYQDPDYMKSIVCAEDTCSFCNVCNICSDHKSNFDHKNKHYGNLKTILKKLINTKK